MSHELNTTTAAAGGDFLLGGDLQVNRLGFGAMRLALGGRARDPEAGIAVLRRAVELGVNHIDTAGFYGFGDIQAHELIRQALSPYPADLVIASKVGPLLEGGIVPTGQATADQLRGLVEEDLRRLAVDRRDLVYLRVGGRGEPGGESIGERFAVLAELHREGLIRHLGVSHVDAAQLAEARSIAPVAAVQNQFHVHYRADADVARAVRARGHRVRAVLSARRRCRADRPDPPRERRRPPPGDHRAGRPGLATRHFTGDIGHPRHRLARSLSRAGHVGPLSSKAARSIALPVQSAQDRAGRASGCS